MSGVSPKVENVENLVTPTGTTVLTGIERVAKAATVFNFQVAVNHDYYALAGATPILVHNASYWPTPKSTGPTDGSDPWESAVRHANRAAAADKFCAKCGIEDADGKRWRTRQGQIAWLCYHHAQVVQYG